MLGITKEEYDDCVEKSLVSTGKENGRLIKNVLDKLRGGKEQVYVAAIGGSVTEGAGPEKYTDGYAYQFAERLKVDYAADSEKVSFVGAGLGGTPSVLGLIRYENHVIEALGTDPDLLIIEFSVNDWQECSNSRAYERLIRNALEKGTAVICLYAVATYENQQAAHSPVAQFYGVPEVSIKDGIKDSKINQEKDSKIFYSDYVHPVKEGHTLMVDCLMNLLKKIDDENASGNYKAVIPEGYKNEKPFTSFKSIFASTKDSDVKIDAGGFCKKDDNSQVLMKSATEKSFPDNWFLSTASAQAVTTTTSAVDSSFDKQNLNHGDNSSASFKISLECKALILVYKHAGGGNPVEFGKADIFVDGTKTATYDGDEPGGWNDCKIVMVIDEVEAANHTVEIKMAAGDEAKGFTILGLGYIK